MIRDRAAEKDPSRQRERAEVIALEAVHFLLEDEENANGFMLATGCGTDDLGARLNEPDFLGGVLDYLLSREDLLIPFCEARGLDPMLPGRLRHLLP